MTEAWALTATDALARMRAKELSPVELLASVQARAVDLEPTVNAFTEEREADNLRARIALTGLEAAVRPVTVPDKGTLYRVRLGPYQSLDDANRIKTALSQNGVGAAIIRTTDEAAKKP